MAFSLHNHCLCRVGAWSRTSHAWSTPDVRNLIGMHAQESSGFIFCSFFGCFLTKEKQRSARNCTRSWNWSAESKVYGRAGAAQQSTAGHVCLRRNLPKMCCSLKQRLNCRQARRHCQETLSKCSWHEPRAARLTHTLSLFCFCVLVTSKMSHGVNKSSITQHVVAQARRLRVWGRSKFTKHSLTLQEKALHFFFWISQCMLAVGALETWTWWPHLANFHLDVLIVVFSGSGSFSRIWSHGERERERERGWVRDWTELTAVVNFAFSSMPNDMHAEEKQSRLERELKCKSEESDNLKRTVAYRPAVSIRFSRSLSFPTCLYLTSPLSGSHEWRPIASRKEQLSSLFFVAWTTQPLHEKLLMGFKNQVH